MLGRLRNLWPSERLEGYEHPELVDVIFRKTVAFQPREAWPEIVGAETVLDFGGGCGIHYKQAGLPNVRWAVVETPEMARRAKELETEQLRFFTSIDTAASWLGPIDVLHSNGAIQYTPEPLSTLHQLVGTKPRKLLWYRLSFGEGSENQVSRLIDNGPGKLSGLKNKSIAYLMRKIQERDFLAAHSDFRLEVRGVDWFRFLSNASSLD